MKDLTKGSVSKIIFAFALPMFWGQIIQLFYSITDTWIIGNVLGDTALAAVGSVTPINDLIVGFLIGLTNGFAILTAQYFGAKNYKAVRNSFAASIVLGSITTIILTVSSLIFLPQLLQLINMKAEHIDNATQYITYILLGMFASMLYNVFASTLRSLGDTKAALMFLVISALLNIVLTYCAMKFLHTGVAGASIATVISQLISAILSFIYIKKKYPLLDLSKEDFSLDKELIKKLLSSGLSMGLMGSLVSLGTLLLQSSINTFSENIIVAHYAARKLTSIFMLPLSILGMTMASYCSQNYGAGEYQRIKLGLTTSLKISWFWCGFIILVSYTITPILVSSITSTSSKEVIDTAVLYLKIDTLLYFVTAIISIYRNALQGMGEYITPIFSSSIELIGKFFTIIFLVPSLGYMGIILSEPIIWCIMVIPLIIKVQKITENIIQSK